MIGGGLEEGWRRIGGASEEDWVGLAEDWGRSKWLSIAQNLFNSFFWHFRLPRVSETIEN